MPSLNTRQRDALVWFNRRSPDAIGPYELADHLAGGDLQGHHPAGAEKLIRKLAEAGYLIATCVDEALVWRITPPGREEARRIQDGRRQAGRPLVLKNPPAWATTHLGATK